MASTNTHKPAAAYRTDNPRADGWTGERQAKFLMAVAHCGMISLACKAAGMSDMSAYLLRREPRGMAFHLGWQRPSCGRATGWRMSS